MSRTSCLCIWNFCLWLACVYGVPISENDALGTQILNYHNDARKAVRDGTAVGINGVLPQAKSMPDLEWSSDLADTASQWAEACGIVNGKTHGYCTHSSDPSVTWQPSPTYAQLGLTPSTGENLGCPSQGNAFPGDGERMVKNWLKNGMIDSERKLWKYGTRLTSCWIAKTNQWGWYDCGHYTQIIWADVLKVGCAYANCNKGNKGAFFVCHYWPSGNYRAYPYELKDLSQHPDWELCIAISQLKSDSEGTSYNGQWALAGSLNGKFPFYTKSGLNNRWLCYDTWRKYWCITEDVAGDQCSCSSNDRWAQCNKETEPENIMENILSCENKWEVYTSSGYSDDTSVSVSSCSASSPVPSPTPPPTSSSSSSDDSCVTVSGFPTSRTYKNKKLSNLNGEWVWNGEQYVKGTGKMQWGATRGKWRVGGSYNAWGWCTSADVLSCSGRWQYKKYNSAGNVVTTTATSATFSRCGALEVAIEYPCYQNFATRLQFRVNGSHAHEFERVDLAGCVNDAPQWTAGDNDTSPLLLMRGEGWMIVEDAWDPYPKYVCYEELLVDCVEGAWQQVVVTVVGGGGSDESDNDTLSVGGPVAYETAYATLSEATLVSIESNTADETTAAALGANGVVAIVLVMVAVVAVAILVGVCYVKRKRKEMSKQMKVVADDEREEEEADRTEAVTMMQVEA